MSYRPKVRHCNQVCIFSRFQDNGLQTYWGHALDLSVSHNVIDHLSVRFAMPFLIGDQLTERLSPTVFEIFDPKNVNEPMNEPTNKQDGSQYLLLQISSQEYSNGQ